MDMCKFKILKRGLITAFCFLLVLVLMPTPVFAYGAILRLGTSLVSGATVHLFKANPNQDSNTSSAGYLATPADYSISTSSSGNQYSVISSSTSNWALILKGTTYAIIPFSADSPVPVQTPRDGSYLATAVFYQKGTPAAPYNLRILSGYETGKANWDLHDEIDGSGFEYSWVRLRVLKGDRTPVTRYYMYEGAPADETLTTKGKIKEYAFGQLVDGRTLETDADGQPYYFQVMGVVDGSPLHESAWTEGAFTTLPAGAGAAPFTLTLESGVATGKPGINSFSMPFPPDPSGRWWLFKTDGSKLLDLGTTGTNEVVNAGDLLVSINNAAGGTVVTSFGMWKRDLQVLDGTMITYSGDNPWDVDRGPAMDLVSRVGNLKVGEGYQVYIGKKRDGSNPPARIELVIKNTP